MSARLRGAAGTGLVLALAGLLSGCGSTSVGSAHPRATARHPATGLVGYPSYLPRATVSPQGDTVLVGTAARPALTNQGDPVKVETPAWSVLIAVSGPEVPGEGLPYRAPASTCTWSVTLSDASGTVPVSAADFDSIDNLGHVYHPYLVPGQPRPPSRLDPGQTVSFELRAAEPVGEGLMRWAPDGQHIVAKWDFVVEND